MGDPRRPRKKWEGPTHPWQMQRIIEEKELKKEYWYKNKRELWKMRSILRKFRRLARILIGKRGLEASKKEEQVLLDKLYRLGLLEKDAKLEDVLNLTIRDIMERRLQTLVYRKGLAHTIKEARQLIVHKHVAIGDQIINSPSYLVSREEENKIRVVE